MKNIILVLDKIYNKHFIVDGLVVRNYHVTIIDNKRYNDKNRIKKWRKLIIWYQYCVIAIRALVHSKKNDLLISWNFVIGTIISLFSVLFNLKRNIIALNMIVHKKNIINSMIRRIIYNISINNKYFIYTINSAELYNYYHKQIRIRNDKYYVLPDPVLFEYEKREYQTKRSYVFCGGEACRDWVTIIKVATILSTIKFVFVARKKYFPQNIKIPKNVNIYFDIPQDEFSRLLSGAYIVVIPLLSTAPAGLIVLLRAANLCIPIIATSSPSIRNYIINYKTGILVNYYSVDEIVQNIVLLDRNQALRRKYSTNMYNYIQKEYCIERYMDKLENIILTIK